MSSEKTKTISTKLAVKTPKILQDLQSYISAMDGFALQDDPEATQVDILVLEIGDDPVSELDTLRTLLREGVVGTLFITSAQSTSDILLPAMRAGAKEFFQQPIVRQEVIGAFSRVAGQYQQQDTQKEMPSKNGKILSVHGAKGGVGTTTFAVNLATSIQQLADDKQVALIDLNRLVGEVPLFLDLETDFNWEEIGKNMTRLDDAYLKSAMTQHSSGLYVMPAPNKVENGVNLPQDFLVQMIQAMQRFFDYIIVDTGMYFDNTHLGVFEKSETIYLISTLSLPCIINVKRLKESLQWVGGATKGKVQVIANRFEKKSQISLAEASKLIDDDISITIPNDYTLTMNAINRGKALAEVGKNSTIAKSYAALAASIVGKPKPKRRRWKLFN